MVINSNTSNFKTVYVIGAGASNEVDLPIGTKLKEEIARILNFRFDDGGHMKGGDRVVADALDVAASQNTPPSRDINPYFEASCRIRDGMPQAQSIDNYLDVHSDNEKIVTCGKLAIVRSILEAEKKSKLYFERTNIGNRPDFNKLKDTWFNHFFQLLTENCKAADLETRFGDLVLVIFNYDRCVEHFLYWALQNYYNILPDRAASLVKGIEIYHPYGSVGSLPWHKPTNAVDFGASPTSRMLFELTSQIKTFTEGTDVLKSSINTIREHLKTAHRLVFLGFAFHRLNLELLLPSSNIHSQNQHSHRHLYATAISISDSDVEIIKSELSLRAVVDHNYTNIRNDLECSKLFHEYRRSLAFR